eukprot:s3923_g2.t1
MGGKQESVHFFHTYKQKVDYVFVDHPTFLERVNGQTGSKLYGPEWGKDFADNQAHGFRGLASARFAYFCKAALKAIQEHGYEVGLPMAGGKWRNTKTAFLCHNAVFQGRFQREERSLVRRNGLSILG